jgi:transcriptional regulator with XRE-family HTH domain
VIRRFDANALHKALDARRKAEHLTWQQVASAIGVSAATITRTRNGGRMEVDGMLAMVDWLKRPVEDFVRPSEAKRSSRR